MFDIYNEKNTFCKNVLPRRACGFPLNDNNEAKVRTLSGNWKFKFCHNYTEIPADFTREDFDTSSFDTVKVPSEWQILGYDVPLYANIKYPYELSMNPLRMPHVFAKKTTVGLYATDFIVDKKSSNTRLYFGGINPSGEIYLNGKFVGYSEDTFSYQEYDVTGIVKQGRNRLSVVVFRYCTGSYLEDQDMWRLSGIFRDVYLVENATKHIEDAYYICKLSKDYSKADLTLYTEYTSPDKNVELGAELIGPDGNKIAPFTIKKNEDGKAVFTLSLDDIKLWSHETPNLYHIVVILKASGVTYDKRLIPCGLREVKIVPMKNGKGPFILLNGKPLKFRGVNRHEFHPEYGHAVPTELIKKDLEICLHNNITAIRCSHYPNKHVFYDLCDKMGILVIAETNLETHGLSYILPRNSKYWEKQCVYRAVNMVTALRNHPCIVSWSLGNEAGCGKVFANMKKAVLSLDTSRFIHYEGDVTGKISDVMSEMYTHQEKMKEIGKGEKPHIHGKSLAYPFGKKYSVKKYRDLPFMECEYAHCMGNSLGNFSDYWDDFKKYDRLAGGFIWDFADQSIKVTDDDGTVRWTYGGDFGDKPNFGSFCFNGILRADRSPNPAFFEV
ncbi:MAG: beta-galactosidase, partial [Clostridia bacterium]|nr:beta-galactosidase [Clostridia bacterium]